MAIAPHTYQQDRNFALLTAVVAGDATLEDGLAQLRGEGVDSLESALSVLAEGLRRREEEEARSLRRVDLKGMRMKAPSDPSRIAAIRQRVPKVPFTLNGTTYDPKDIERFNGRELHFVAAPAGDHMLVVDDRELIAQWWQITYLEQFRLGGAQLLDGASAQTAQTGGPQPSTREFHPRTWFYEDINLGGGQLYLDAGRAYKDLTQVSLRWPFGGDWNDKISSVYMLGTQTAILFEHINWVGQTLTLQPACGATELRTLNLNDFGWNDRASSLETF